MKRLSSRQFKRIRHIPRRFRWELIRLEGRWLHFQSSLQDKQRLLMLQWAHYKPFWEHLFHILTTQGQQRYLLMWWQSTQPDYLLTQAVPWITFDAARFLKSQLHKQKCVRVFEYGSGASTLFWLKHCDECTSVEHDPEWFEVITQRVTQAKKSHHFDYRLVMPHPINGSAALQDPSSPTDYLSTDSAFTNYSFKEYVSQIDQFPEAHFDIILIDGRARPACIVHSLNKIKPGGMIIVDNADRSYYFTYTGRF